MTFPVALIPAAVSAVQSLMTLRGKVDTVLSVSRANDSVPLLLPRRIESQLRNPADPARMAEVFSGDTPERQILLARGLGPDFQRFQGAEEGSEEQRVLLFRLLGALYEIEDARRDLAASPWLSYPDPEHAGLDYFLVASYQDSARPPAVQILLAVSETLVEFAGQNAALFVSREETHGVVSTLLREFAARSDLETDSARRLVRALLGSAAVAATDHAGALPQHPALGLLYASLGRVRSDMGDDFVQRIVSHEGFQAVVADWLTAAAEDPELTRIVARIGGLGETGYDPNDPATLPLDLQPAYGALSAMLGVIGQEVGAAAPFSDPLSFRRVFDAALNGLARHAGPLIAETAQGRPVLGAVLRVLVDRIAANPGPSGVLASGEVAASLYAAVIEAFATSPDLDGDGAVALAEALAQGLADELSREGPAETLALIAERRGSLLGRRLVVRLLDVLAERPEALVGDGRADAVALLGAVLEGAGPLVADGVAADDVVALADVDLGSVAERVDGRDLPEAYRAALGAMRRAVADRGGLGGVTTRADRREVLLLTARSLAQSSAVWQELARRGLAAPLVDGLAAGLSAPTGGARGRAAAAFRPLLAVLVRHALALADHSGAADAAAAALRDRVRRLVAAALGSAAEKVGRGIDGEEAGELAARVLDRLLREAGPDPLARLEELGRETLAEMADQRLGA